MSAMIGAAISTDRPIARAGRLRLAGEDRDVLEAAERAEAKLAEDVQVEQRERRDARAQRVILVQMAGEQARARAARAPRRRSTSMMTPPALCTHFPTDSPIVDSDDHERMRITADDSATNHVLVVIHAAFGPSAYARYVAHCRPISDVFTMTNSQRFHASMKPTVSLNPSFAH